MYKANGIITLTTDFGLRDPFVGIMKGVILSRLPQARLVDLTHAIDKFAIHSAGFWARQSAAWFPAGTVHLAVVDPGVGSDRAMRMVRYADQLWVAPDNGLLDEIELGPQWQGSRVFTVAQLDFLQLPTPSATFHGRDVFAPVVAELAAGRLLLTQWGTDVAPRARQSGAHSQPDASGKLAGTVVHIDDFGNLFTSLRAEQVACLINPCIHIAGQVIEIKRTYSDVPPGELLALINAFEVLEIAVNQGSASSRLKLSVGAALTLQGKTTS